MIVLAVLAVSWVVYDAHIRVQERQYAKGRTAGALFASWMLAAHRKAQEEELVDASGLPDTGYVAQLTVEPGVEIAMAADLQSQGYAPTWLVDDTALGQAIELGVIDDGGGVPMAFAVAAPSRGLSVAEEEGFRAGAAAGGVIGVEALATETGVETFGGGRRAGIEHAIGRPLAAGDRVAVADLGIVYDDRVVHRRRQPGRAYLSEMETDLAFFDPDGAGPAPAPGIVDAGVVSTATMEVPGSGTPGVAAFIVGRAATDPDFDPDGDGVVGATVSADVVAGTAGGAGSVQADVVYGESDGVFANRLGASTWHVGGALAAGQGTATRELTAMRVNAVADPGTGEGGLLAGGPKLAVEGRLEVNGEFGGDSVDASTAGSGSLTSGTVRGTTAVDGANTASDRLDVTGTLRVTGQCYGC